jgi:hypothetical protein
MLVFGGLTYRDYYYDDELLFHSCPQSEDSEEETEGLDPGCGEQILNDLWRYHIER